MFSTKYLVVLSAFLGISSCRRLIAHTVEGKNCITECKEWFLHGIPGKWCKPNFDDWSRCEETDGFANIYFTSLAWTDEHNCDSDCVKGPYNIYRCLTNVYSRKQDSCSPQAGVSAEGRDCLSPCSKTGNVFTCPIIHGGEGVNEFCSPPPVEFFRENLKKSYMCIAPPSMGLTRKRRSIDPCDRPVGSVDFGHYYDIEDLVEQSECNYEVNVSCAPDRPNITFSSTVHAGVRVLHSVRARLTIDTIPPPGFSRTGHPPGVNNHMINLDQQPYDEIGHVIGLWGGGPNDLLNLVPQDRITNRNAGHTSERYSFWRQTESYIQWVIRHPTTLFVDIWFYLFYEGNLDDVENRRPVGFGLRYITTHNNGQTTDSSDCTFENSYDRS